MKSEGLRKLLQEERSAGTENLQAWLAKRDEADAGVNEAREYLERLEALLALLDRPEAEALPMWSDQTERHSRYKNLSIADAAHEVLSEVGTPLHAERILAAVLKGGKVISSKTPLLSLTPALHRDGRFQNIGCNTWRIKQSSEEATK